jgi:catechol 2,3-dioxygenase-like lactoylglutathione lyase family enzyme
VNDPGGDGMESTTFRIGHVELRVRRVDESARFYERVFGLVAEPIEESTTREARLFAVQANGATELRIVLRSGLPRDGALVGLDHLAVAVACREDVLAMYRLARAEGAMATAPRVYGGHLQSYLFDPDGYKIEVYAPEAETKGVPLPARRSAEPTANVVVKGLVAP